MVAVSGAYFWLGRREKDRVVLALVSAHGLVAALLYVGAIILWETTRAYRPNAALPFLALHLIPVALIIYSFLRFKGPKLLHVMQLANVASMFYTVFIGGMAVTGDWL